MFARQSSSFFPGWKRRVCVSVAFQLVCSSVFVAEFREDIPITIPALMEHLTDSKPDVRRAAMELLSRLAAQGLC